MESQMGELLGQVVTFAGEYMGTVVEVESCQVGVTMIWSY